MDLVRNQHIHYVEQNNQTREVVPCRDVQDTHSDEDMPVQGTNSGGESSCYGQLVRQVHRGMTSKVWQVHRGMGSKVWQVHA